MKIINIFQLSACALAINASPVIYEGKTHEGPNEIKNALDAKGLEQWNPSPGGIPGGVGQTKPKNSKAKEADQILSKTNEAEYEWAVENTEGVKDAICYPYCTG